MSRQRFLPENVIGGWRYLYRCMLLQGRNHYFPCGVCTHRPVLPVVLDAVAEHLLTKKQKEHLPAKDPYLEPGDILVRQVSAYERGGIISAEVVRPFTD